MFIVDETTGDITMTQGDTGDYVITGLPTDKNYVAYFAIQDENRNAVGSEIQKGTNLRSSVTFFINKTLSDLLTVKKNKEYQIYYFGVKLCDSSSNEDTLVIGNKEVGEKNTITVYPKKVEGD